MKVTITDTAGTSGTITTELDTVATAITPWYPDAPATILDAIDDLQAHLLTGEDYTAAAEFLGILVTAPDED